MSFHVASVCTRHKFGSATRKQVITFLADKASDDGSGIWCSKGTVAQSTELSKSTVKRVFLQFLTEGIIVETGRRNNSHGFTVEYCINLDKVAELPLTKEQHDVTGVTVTNRQNRLETHLLKVSAALEQQNASTKTLIEKASRLSGGWR